MTHYLQYSRLTHHLRAGIFALAMLSPGATIFAETRTLEAFSIIGSPDAVINLPGAAFFIDTHQIRDLGLDNIDQVLRRVPGVYFRTEDGYGLFPNVSLRGVGSMRTSQVAVMEDGILSAPAPYASPAAYYTPTTGRMSGVEIIKGSSQVRHGPQNTGGVINYISTPIPFSPEGYFRSSFGSDGDIRLHAWYGDRQESDWGTLGYVVEFYHRSVDGFKQIDETPDFPAGANTGFVKNEPMIKLLWELPTAVYQAFEFKLGFTDMDANETYLGLSEADFRVDPFRRYAASRFDRIETEHYRTYLSYTVMPTDSLQLNATAYFNRFSRSWFKLQEVSTDPSTSAARPGAANRSNLSAALAEAGDHLAVLRGEAAGTLRYRNNNRAYQSYGLQQTLLWNTEALGARHAIQAGLRLHYDYEDRFQNETNFNQLSNGTIDGTFVGIPGTQENRKGFARAFAAYVEDEISWSNFSLRPGIRFESIRLRDLRRGTNPNNPNFNQTTQDLSRTLNIWSPGIGAVYHLNEEWRVFGGIHRGFRNPSPGAATNANNPIEEETSTGYEIGVRFTGLREFSGEAVLFLTDFSNLIVPANIGGAGSGAGFDENAGSARVAGLELSGNWNASERLNLGFDQSFSAAVTLTTSELTSDVNADGDGGGSVESIFAGGSKGNKLPYIPEFQFQVGSRTAFGDWTILLDAFYTGSTFGTANNTDNLRRGVNADGPLDSRFGKNDAYFLLDASVSYQLRENLRVIGAAQNLLDESYIASRIPHGPRPGHPRFVSLALEMTF